MEDEDGCAILGLFWTGFFVAYVGVGFLQLWATYAGAVWLGLGTVLAVIADVALAWVPVAGTVCGVLGAHYVWGWGWLSIALLFFLPYVLVAVWGACALVKIILSSD